MLTLQALDLRAVAADLEIVDRRSESDPDNSTLSVVREHVGELEDHLSTLDDRLDAIDYAEWHNQYDSRLAAFDGELKRFNPPVDWGAVLSALQKAQKQLNITYPQLSILSAIEWLLDEITYRLHINYLYLLN